MRILLCLIIGLLASSPAHAWTHGVSGGGSGSIGNTALRSPTAQDDSSRGNQVGELWLNTVTDVIYQSSSVALGNATWASFYSATTLPCDLTIGGQLPTICFGTKPLTVNWANGHLWDIACSNSTTATINAIGGQTDIATLLGDINAAIAAGASGGNNLGCQISKWYDQSGNANNATQATSANQPWVRVINSLAHNAYSGSQSTGGGAGTYSPEYLSLPSITWSPSAISCFVVGFQVSAYNTGTPLELGTTSSNFAAIYNNGFLGGTNGFQFGVSDGANDPAVLVDNSLDVWWMVEGTSTGFGGINEQTGSNLSGNASVGTPVGGTIGNSLAFPASGNVGVQAWEGEIDGVVCWPVAMTTTQAQTARMALYQAFNVTPQQSNDLVVLGTGSYEWGKGSNALGGQGANAYGPDRQMLASLSRPVTFLNYSNPGFGAVNFNAEYGSVSPHYSALHNKNILVFGSDGNDFPALTPAQAFTDTQTVCTNAVTTGFTGVILTLIVDNEVNYPAWQATENALLLDGPIACTYTSNLGYDQFLGNLNNAESLPWFNTGNPHPTGFGYGIYATYLTPQVNAILASQSPPTPYVGPGDIVSGANVFYGVRAYNAAYAAANGKLLNIVRSSDSHACDVLATPFGGMGVTASCGTGGDNGQSAYSFCLGATCSVATLYDQSGALACGGSACDLTQATSALQPPLQFYCSGAQPCIGPWGIGRVMSRASSPTQGQPFTFSQVYELSASNLCSNNFCSFLVSDAAGNYVGSVYDTSGGLDTFSLEANPISSRACSSFLARGVFHASQGVFNGNASTGFTDGSASSCASGVGTAGMANSLLIGADGFGDDLANALMSEIGAWPGAFNGTQQSAMNTNQHSFYGF
jgi:hypothetical protein